MKINFKSKGKKHEDKVPRTSLVPAELARIKKAKISLTSKYWRPEKVHDTRQVSMAFNTLHMMKKATWELGKSGRQHLKNSAKKQ